jgi:hypothetical protein
MIGSELYFIVNGEVEVCRPPALPLPESLIFSHCMAVYMEGCMRD